MDEALRTAEVGAHSAPGAFYSAFEEIRDARLALQQGSEAKASNHLQAAIRVIRPAREARPPTLDVTRYAGAKVIDPEGAIIGEVTGTSPDAVDVALGGWRDAWGFIDFSAGHRASVPVASVAFGPPRAIGMRLVMVPTGRETSVAISGTAPSR
jgi:hypothetical protein